jgi:hypothetical protein
VRIRWSLLKAQYASAAPRVRSTSSASRSRASRSAGEECSKMRARRFTDCALVPVPQTKAATSRWRRPSAESARPAMPNTVRRSTRGQRPTCGHWSSAVGHQVESGSSGSQRAGSKGTAWPRTVSRSGRSASSGRTITRAPWRGAETGRRTASRLRVRSGVGSGHGVAQYRRDADEFGEEGGWGLVEVEGRAGGCGCLCRGCGGRRAGRCLWRGRGGRWAGGVRCSRPGAGRGRRRGSPRLVAHAEGYPRSPTIRMVSHIS